MTRDDREPARRAYPFEIRAAGAEQDGATRIEGIVSMFGTRNSYGEVAVPGAFAESLAAKNESRNLPMGLYHREVIGLWREFDEDPATGLKLAGDISDTQQGRDAATLVRDGALTGLSMGFWPLEETLAEPGEKVTFQTPLGTFTYQYDGWTFYMTKIDILEGSLVMVPADDDARLQRSVPERAGRALPGLAENAGWEDVAWSMAVLLGARSPGDFADLADVEHRAVYDRLARAYGRHGRQAPAYQRAGAGAPAFGHGELALFHDRRLRSTLNDVPARVQGLGPESISAETRQAAQEAADALTPLLNAGGQGAEYARLRDQIAGLRASLTP